MSAVKSFLTFWYDFVFGDDWTIAAGVVAGMGVTYGLLKAGGIDDWWLLPLAVTGILALSIARANGRGS